jgi:hypothetical protein
MSDYLSCAETAALLRGDLKRAFPGVRFSVRSSTYSGGASITVRWSDGPRRAAVEPIAQRYAGASFDGMIDLKSHHDILVNGVPRRTLADFVFCERRVTDEEAKTVEAGAMIRARCAIMPGTVPSADRFGNNWVDQLARGMAMDCDADGSLEGAFRRVVLRDDS